MPKFKILRATLDHANDIGYVTALSWQAAYKSIVPYEFLSKFTPEKRSKKFKKVMLTRLEEHYVAYLDKAPIGTLVIGAALDKDASKSIGEVGAIYLLPEFWGKGYGKRLMDFGVTRLKEMGYKAITLWVLEENQRARSFYEKYGYMLDGAKKEISLGKPLFEVRYRLQIKL